MVDNIFVLNQVYELQIILNKLCDLFIQIPEPFPMGEIIAKLPPNLNKFRKKLLHMSKITLEKFRIHLCSEEESRIRDGTNLNSKVNEQCSNRRK
jgi:hypothetical protein